MFFSLLENPIGDSLFFKVFTYHDSTQVEKRKQMAKFYKQIDVKLDTKPLVI